MKKSKLFGVYHNVVVAALVLVVLCKISYCTGKNTGWDNGANEVFKATMDTVTHILDKQIASDTTRTRLVIITPDTVTYILSRKTVLGTKK